MTRSVRAVMSCFILSQFTLINTSTLSTASKASVDLIRNLKHQLLNVKWNEMKDQKHARLIEYELNVLNAVLTNMSKQLKLEWKAWTHLQNQIDILKCEWNESEERLAVEIAVLKGILNKFRNNHKIIMLKQIICNNFIINLVQLNCEVIIMFSNTLKYMNNSEDSVTFACVYHEILIDFVKIYKKKSQYLLLNLNTEIMFCKSSMLLNQQMQIIITNLAVKQHNSDHQIIFFKLINISKILNHASHVKNTEVNMIMKKADAVRKTVKDYESLITEETVDVWLCHEKMKSSWQWWKSTQHKLENMFMKFVMS